MKSKKSIYFLLPVTLLVWGFVVYRVFDFTNEGSVPVGKRVAGFVNDTLNSFEPDTFSLLLNYRDPFLDKAYNDQPKAVKHITKTTNNNQSKKIKGTGEKKWPNVIYSGMISSKNSTKQLGMLNIEGKDYMLETGQEASDIKVIRLYSDSVRLSLGSESKIIFRKR